MNVTAAVMVENVAPQMAKTVQLLIWLPDCTFNWLEMAGMQPSYT